MGGGITAAGAAYDRCMAGRSGILLNAGNVAMSHESPYSLYCTLYGDESRRDPPDPFLRALAGRGMEHESEVLEAIHPGRRRAAYSTLKEGFMMALESMAGGSTAISNPPIFHVPSSMYGKPDLLEREEGGSELGGHHYAVTEIKVARKVAGAHVLQAAFYTMLIGRVQGRIPDSFSIVNGDGEKTGYSYAEHEGDLADALDVAFVIRDGGVPPAIYGAGVPPWTRLCNEAAAEARDVSMIPGVGRKRRDAMVAAGFRTVEDVAASSREGLRPVRGVGASTSGAYLASARALASGNAVRRAPTAPLPDRGTEMFLDLEGINPLLGDDITDYLIGVLVRRGGREEYLPFVAEDGDEWAMLRHFLDWLGTQDDYVIYHWHHYERTHLAKLMDTHGRVEPGLTDAGTMVDLSRVATDAFAFPTCRNSIKDVARWMGFSWRHEGVGALSAITVYQRYREDPEANREAMGMVIDYNEDDCAATRVVRDWLASQEPPAPARHGHGRPPPGAGPEAGDPGPTGRRGHHGRRPGNSTATASAPASPSARKNASGMA